MKAKDTREFDDVGGSLALGYDGSILAVGSYFHLDVLIN
ncbi:hypothetical Protein YC6258_03036 [Gynuella sunshinyii YC6258]|uniref:Uncharacterized protein n=1 Tax=Gynuella sunshinyii YC6258 TaxID=1445510 RepID=A0A0C5VXB3_9GAMM|nr:hypothetical Protein YC6258_03036 [Gynuella sunshinyii YC6258]